MAFLALLWRPNMNVPIVPAPGICGGGVTVIVQLVTAEALWFMLIDRFKPIFIR